MMTRLPDLNAVVLAALLLPAGPERSAYLDQACTPNLTFRRQVEAILRAHDEADAGFRSVRGPGPVEVASAHVAEMCAELVAR